MRVETRESMVELNERIIKYMEANDFLDMVLNIETVTS